MPYTSVRSSRHYEKNIPCNNICRVFAKTFLTKIFILLLITCLLGAFIPGTFIPRVLKSVVLVEKQLQTVAEWNYTLHQDPMKEPEKRLHENAKKKATWKPLPAECRHISTFERARALISSYQMKSKNVNFLSYYYDTPESLVSAAKRVYEEFPLHDLPIPKPGSKCVIVGSGGIVLQFPNVGEMIDRYDYVIRLNFAPTRTYEQFVGSKTDLVFGYMSASKTAVENNRERNNSHIIFGGEYTKEFEDLLSLLKTRTNSKLAAMYKTSKFTMYGHYTKNWIKKNFWKGMKVPKHRRPTTGLQALVLIAHWCPTPPDFAGFGFVANENVPYHYFDNSTLSGWFHSVANEITVINKLQLCNLLGRDLTSSVPKL